MRNPCQTCERALLDKNECSLGCERRYEYCKRLGLPGYVGKPPAPAILREREVAGSIPTRTTKNPKVPEVPKLPKLPRLPRPPKTPKSPRTCPNHPDRPALKYYRECLECVSERKEKSARAREERRQDKEQARALKQQAKALKPPYDWHATRPMRSKAGRLGHAEVCIKNGKGNRETHRLTGMHTHTVAKLRKVLEEQNGGPFLCSCGRPVTHKGMCSHRKAKCPILSDKSA